MTRILDCAMKQQVSETTYFQGVMKWEGGGVYWQRKDVILLLPTIFLCQPL